MKLKSAAKLFLDSYPNLGTRRAYEQCLEPLFGIVSPDEDVKGVSAIHLIQFSQLVEKQKWAAATKRKHIKGIKTFFNWLVNYELIDKSPAKAIKTKRLETYISRDKAMTQDELDELLAYVRYKPRDYALVLFLADTGCRAGGAAGLRVEDIDFKRLSAKVTEKGDKTRNVVFGSETANALRVWLLQRKLGAGPYVFNRNGVRMNADNISLVIRRACNKIGIRSLGAHTLRHRKGHQLADQKVAPSIAATALGHSDPIITLQNYYPADWETAEKELRQLVIEEMPKRIVKIGG